MGKKKPSESPHRKFKVLIVDDHPIVRQGVAMLIGREPDLAVCGEANDAPEALKKIPALQPDVAIVDLFLKEGSGLELIKDLKVRHPKLRILVLSMHDESVYAERAIRAGATGYLMKEEAPEKVIVALRRVLAGEIFLSEKVSQDILTKFAGGAEPAGDPVIGALTDRELEVFRLIGHGWATRQIAEKLHLSVKTIETYRENIKRKLNLRDGAELLHHAIQWSRTAEI